MLIQHVEVRWTKYDRGPEQGAIRNALRLDFGCKPPGESAAGWLQHIRLDAPNYAPREYWKPFPLDPERDGIRVLPQREFASVFLETRANDLYLQKPDRAHLSGLIAKLPFGQQLVIRVNAAIDGDHQRMYADHLIRIAYADAPSFDLPLFREIDERVSLY